MKWKQNSEIIAFSFAFFYVNVLKYFGYYPISTDCITTMLAFAGAYYYLKKSNIGLLVTGLISFITIPILSAVLFILALFPKTPVENLDTKDQLSYNIYRILRSICIIAVPALTITYALYVKIHNPETTSLFSALTGFRGARNWPSAILAIAIIPLFYYYATTILKVNWRDILLSFCNKKIFIRLILGSITFILLYYWLKSIGGESYFSMIDQFSRMLQYPSTDILIFLQTHFHFLGIFFLLFLLYWNDIVDFVRVKFGIGYFIIMLSLLIFIMEIETRKLICFYPFMLIPLISILNQKQIKLWVVFAIPIISLITSHFWYTFNVPGIEEAFLSRDYHSFLNYPAQRYYQFQGSFQSHSVYFKSIILEIILVFSIYLLNKKGLIYTI